MYLTTINNENYAVINREATHSALFIYNEIFHDKVYGVIKEGDVVVDVGANIGLYSKYAINNGASKVICFEPDPENGDMLKENIKLHDLRSKTRVIRKGAWSKTGKTKFTSYSSKKGSCCVTDCSSRTVSDTSTNYNIALTTIDKELANVEQVDIIKIDIEGSEMEALEGAKETILKHLPYIAVASYHNKDDRFLITNFILSLVPDYKVKVMGNQDKILHFYR